MQPKSRKNRAIVAICGCTGTGKSQLAVELAQQVPVGIGVSDAPLIAAVGAEIISADSMQMYRGLDVITNKVTKEEMADVPHHLLSVLDPAKGQECDISSFIAEAKVIIEDVYKKQRLPIVVGGTSYYLQHLLFPGNLIATAGEEEENKAERASEKTDVSWQDIVDRYGVHLSEEQKVLADRVKDDHQTADQDFIGAGEALALWQLLRSVDPTMAARWHYKDTRKVLRSIRVLVETGKRQSEWIEEQRREANQSKDGQNADKLIIWLHCDKSALYPRLDRRVDKMIERGLLHEIQSLRTIAIEWERSTGTKVDFARGIFQTIGYKEFDAYLTYREKQGVESLVPCEEDEEGTRLYVEALDAMKAATRRYAKRQASWLRGKMSSAVREAGDRCTLVILDGSDLTKWHENVLQPASACLRALLQDRPLPTVGIRAPDAELKKGISLPPPHEPTAEERDRSLGFDVCPICSSDEPDSDPHMVMRAEWQNHLRGRVHRGALRRRGLLLPRGEDQSEAAQARRAARQASRKSVEEESAASASSGAYSVDIPRS